MSFKLPAGVQPPPSAWQQPAFLELILGKEGAAREAARIAEAEAQKERERKERERLEAMPPEVVLYTVHGTFARGAPWTRRDSQLCLALRRKLGWRVKVVPVDWSGRNQVQARAEGARRLRDALREGLRDHSNADHFVIAHSHGGNVALAAFADRELAQHVSGVLTLATPFLSARAVESDDLLDPFTAFFASLFAGWCVLFAGVYHGHGWSWWPWALGLTMLVLSVLALGMWLASRMRRFARDLAEGMPETALSKEQLVVIRVEGDEAIATLAGARFAGAAVRLLWRIITARLFRLASRVLATIDYGGWRKTAREIEKHTCKRDSLASAGRLQPTSGTSLWETPNVWETTKPVLWQTLPVLMIEFYRTGDHATQLVMLGLMGLYGVPAVFALLLIVLSVPVGVLTSISLLPCGWSVPLAGPFLQLTAEPSPRGAWTVAQFEGTFGRTGLDHSHAYQALDVWSFAAEWIQARRSVLATRATASSPSLT